MAYLNAYKWDVFVSYARFDDASLVPGERGWVSSFVNALRVAVRTYLGEDIALFFDLDAVRSGEDELEDLKRAASSSAIMVVIASPAYCKREWTMAELEAFRRSCADHRRLLVAERLPIGRGDDWPEALKSKIRMQFWHALPGCEAKAPLPLPASSDAYNRLLMDLAHGLQEQLRSMRDVPPPPGTETQPTARRTILIAQATDDVAEEAEGLRRFVSQYPDRFALLPSDAYPQGGDAFVAAFESDLESADLVVQLLGGTAGRMPPDLPAGYTRYQLEAARAAGKPVLQWRHPALDPSAIGDERYRAIVADPEVVVCGFEAFKRQVRDWSDAPESPPRPPDERRVFINADRANLITAEGLAAEFSAERYKPVLPKFDGTTSENRSHLYAMMAECGVVVVVNGVRPPIWFDNQKRLFEVIRAHRKCKPEGLAVCSVPPADELKPEAIGNEFYHIDCSDGWDPERVRSWIGSLQHRDAQAPEEVA